MENLEWPNFPSRGSKEHRKLISDTVSLQEGETDFLKASQLLVQCEWTKWTNYIKNNLRWKDILGMPPNLLQFCLGATFNVLPSASNLVRWRQGLDSSCPLCHKEVGTVIHSLTCCQIALKQGRITFRHDSVLNRIISRIKTVISGIKKLPGKQSRSINFVPAGTIVRRTKSKPAPSGLLHFAYDWKILFDLGSATYQFPAFLANTLERPDICLLSAKSHRVILIELTSPREENMEDSHTKKTDKYDSLCSSIRKQGWIVNFFAIEVGARGYCSKNVLSTLLQLGFTSKLAHTTAKDVSFISMQASFTIWLAADCQEWVQPPLVGTHGYPASNPSVEKTEINVCDPSVTLDISSLPQAATASPKKRSASLDQLENVSECPTSSPSPKSTSRSSFKGAGSPLKKGVSFYSPRCSKRARHQRPAGLVNLGNTCYANAILQALRSIPEFWLHGGFPNSSNDLIDAFMKIIHRIKENSETFTPYRFLLTLSKRISAVSRSQFCFNTQQDASYVLMYLLNDLADVSPASRNSIETRLQITYVCNLC